MFFHLHTLESNGSSTEPATVIFDCISAVGSKWKPPTDFGPDGQPTEINKQVKGTVSMFINWNKPDATAKRVDLEVE